MMQTIINIFLLLTVAYWITETIRQGNDLYILKKKTNEIIDTTNELIRREKENEKSRT